MANYALLKGAIQDVIKTNGNNEITGALLQQSLLAMINSLGDGFQFIGIATPSTNPGTPDQNVFYIASEAGTYSNFSGIVVAENEVAILKWNGTWTKETSGAATAAQLNQLGQKLETLGSRNYGYPNAQGKWYSNISKPYISHISFQVVPGNEIRILAGNNYTFVGYLKTYPNRKLTESDNNTPIDYSLIEGYTGRIQIETNTEYVGTVPADANYIIVALGNDIIPDLDVQYVSIDGKIVYLRNSIFDSLNGVKDDIEILKEQVGEESFTVDSPDGFSYKRRHQISQSTESTTGNRYTLGLNIPKGTTIRVRSTYVPGINVRGYNNFDSGCIGGDESSGKLQDYNSGYLTNEIVGVASVDQVLIVKWKNSDESTITDAQIEQMLASLTVEVTIPGTGLTGDVETLQEQVQEIINNPTDSSSVESDKKLLYIGPLVQKSVSGNTFTDSTIVVTQRCALAVPYYNAKVNIKLPSGYQVGFKTGYSTTGWSLTWGVDSGVLSNGDSYVFDGHNAQVYRVYFTKNNASAITVAEVEDLIASGAIQLIYLSPDSSIVTRNSHTESYVKGLMRKFTGTLANDDSLHNMPILTHLSDIHGDVVRYENFVQYSDSIEADAAIVSGDMVPMCGAEDGTDYIDDIMDKYSVMVLPGMGNHDARSRTTKALQNEVLAHSISKYSLQTPAGETYPTYYYKDIASQSLRIISLNLYCAGQKGTNDWRITQEQITWFIATLASTPENYGIVVVMHSPETITVKDNNHSKFYQSNGGGDVLDNNPWFPFRKIVDAFISKTTLTGTFDETITGDVVETITVNADFTSIASGVEFICYLTGHRHQDAIGYVKDATNLQLMCNIALGFSLYGDLNYHYYAEESDLPRGGKGFVQDSFNVYIIDRATGNLRIARIGSNMNQDFEMRDWMIIPYK